MSKPKKRNISLTDDEVDIAEKVAKKKTGVSKLSAYVKYYISRDQENI